MSFDPIGPYDLRRSDLVAAAIILSFRLGSIKTKIVSGIMAAGGLIMVAGGIAGNDLTLVSLGLLLPILMFVIGPALRSLKYAKNIVLTSSQDGVVADTANARTLYKWATIGAARMIGTRVFVMVTNNCALVVPTNATTSANLKALITTIETHR